MTMDDLTDLETHSQRRQAGTIGDLTVRGFAPLSMSYSQLN